MLTAVFHSLFYIQREVSKQTGDRTKNPLRLAAALRGLGGIPRWYA